MKIKVALVLGLLSATAAVAQSSTGTPRIAGHVYNLQDGQALTGVVVTVESARDSRADQHQLTGADGGYAFGHLEAGEYTITAFRSDLIGEIYGITPQGKGSVSFLDMRPGQSRDNLDFHLRRSPSITEMPSEAMAAAYPQDFANLGVVYGRFSPDGTLLAIVTNGIASGDPEQVWLYDEFTKKLFAVTETPVPKVSPQIDSVVWVGNTLYVDGDRRQSTRHFVVKATAEGAKEISVVPPEAQKALTEATATAEQGGSIVSSYRVRLDKPCHRCPLELSARALKTSRQFTISNEINGNFVFDPTAPVVFYSMTSWNGTIISFNLDTHRSIRLDLPIHRFSDLLAARKEQHGFLLAYAVTSGSCTPKLSPYGEDLWLLPRKIDVRPRQHPISICFVRMHDEE